MGVRGEKSNATGKKENTGADISLPPIKEARPKPLRDAETIRTYFTTRGTNV